MDVPSVDCSPKESPIYGGCQISLSIASASCSHILFDSGHFYLVYEGSDLRHVTKVSSVTYQQADKSICFSSVTPGHNKAESVTVTLYKFQSNREILQFASSHHFFIYDGHYQLAQYILNCHLNDQLYRLGDDDLEEICDVKLLDLSTSEHIHLDRKLTTAFKHVIAKHETSNLSLLYHTGTQGIRAQDTLVHFACRYGMSNFVKLLLQLPGGEECLTTPDTDGQLPVDVAQNAGHVDFINILSRNEIVPPSNEEEPPVVTTNLKWVNKNLEYDISELNRLMNLNINPIDSLTGYNQRENMSVENDMDESSDGCVSSPSTGHIIVETPEDTVDKHVPTTSENEIVSENDGHNPVETYFDQSQLPRNLTDEDKTSKMKCKAVPTSNTENGSDKILEDNILKLRRIHEEIQQIRSTNQKLQKEACEDQSIQASQSWPILNISESNMSNDAECMQQNDAELVCDNIYGDDNIENSLDNKAVKIRVNDVTPSGSQELLCVKTSTSNHDDSQSQQVQETVDGTYGNVKMQLEQRNKKVQKEMRRQSWSGDNKEKHNAMHANQKGQFSHSSLSSMDSDPEEAFYDAQDHAALYGKSDSSSMKQKRPSSVGDIDITGDVSHDICDVSHSDYTSRSSPSSLSLQCLYDGIPATTNEPKTTDDICSKSLSEHQIAKMLNAPLAPPRSLLKSISTPSIIAVNDSNENWAKSSVTMDDSQTSVLTRKQHISVSPNHDSDEDKPFKRKKRSSLFFKKKWGKDKDLKKSNHQFVTVCYSNSTLCDVCAKSLCNKQALRCETCMVKVHENSCHEQISDCTKLKNSRAISKTASYSQPHSSNKEKLISSASFKTAPSGPMFPTASPHQSRNKKQSEVSLSVSAVQDAVHLNVQKSNGSSPSKVISEDKESDMLEETHLNIVETNSASVESLEDGCGDDSDLDDDAELQLRLEEPEQWSSLVDKKFTKKMKDKDVKRQESIYELILTEKHHVLTLKIMQKIFANGMKKEVQIRSDVVDRIFPSLDNLYEIHSSFLRQLRERQKEYTVIPTIGDLLIQQFKSEKAEQLTDAYGEFCSRHPGAVSLYKDILKSDRKFQLFIKKCSMHPLCKARAVPECMLLVTQRITKYPLILDGLIKATRENEEEKSHLNEALSLVKGIISKVNSRVTEKQKEIRLIEIYNKVDAKSTAFYHNKKFKKSDLLSGKRKLHYEGPLIWKSARGKPLEVMTVVLSDIIIFLQESNQKYSFVSQDNKSGILSLQKLLVREKAGQDNRGIYLISSNPLEPEMYELGCSSSKDKKIWIESIRSAIENYPDEGDEANANDHTADRKLIDVKVARIKHLLASLHEKDMCIAQICEDKMAILLELLESDIKSDHSIDLKYTPLLEAKCDPGETRNLLMASLNEASRIASSLYMSGSNLSRSVSSVGEHQSEAFISPALPKRAETFGGFDSPNKEQNPLHKTLKKKLMILKENEKVRGSSVSCTVSPVSEEDGEHLCPVGIHDVRRLSGPPAITESQAQQQPLKRSTNSTNTLSSIAWGGVIKLKSADGMDWTDASLSTSPSVADDAVSQSDTVGELLSLNAVTPSLLMAGKDQLSATVQLTHHLNRLQCLFSQHFTSYEIMKTEFAQLKNKLSVSEKEPSSRDLKEKRSLYKHNQRLEELRNLQEQLQGERQILEKERLNEKNRLEYQEAELDKLQAQLREEQQDVKEQREKLYKQLEVLKRQGILLSPSMQIVNTSLQSPPLESDSPKIQTQTEPISSWEARASKPEPSRKITMSQSTDHKNPLKTEPKQRNVGPNSLIGSFAKRGETPERQTLPVHLCSATNQQKTIHSPVIQQPSSVKQQLPMKLANLSMGTGAAEILPNLPNPPVNAPTPAQNESPQFLPMKLAMEANRQNKANPTRTSSFGGIPRAPTSHLGYVHQRAGSSPAKMHELTHHGDDPNVKMRTSTIPKEKSDKKDVGKKNYETKKQEIMFF